ncbi:Alpha/Beta hydrolase protein, partial [Kalaharituber pfeilii]
MDLEDLFFKLFLLLLLGTATFAWPDERVAYDGYITSNGAERRYKVYAPGPSGRGYETACPGMTRFPLIFAFHGRGASAARMTNISSLDSKSVCAIVVVPFGMKGSATNSQPGVPKRAWEPAAYALPIDQDDDYPPFPPRYRDDKLFVRDMMDRLWVEYGNGIRWDRVYITGKSSGAGFVNHLACTMPERFAAIAPVAGPFVNPDPNRLKPEADINKVCAFNHPMPVINFHGTADRLVPYHGANKWEGSWLPDIQQWAKWWAAKNKCTHYNKTVRHYEITNGVHDWPSKSATNDNTDKESVGDSREPFRPSPIEATPEILNFFHSFSITPRWFREITFSATLAIHDENLADDRHENFVWVPDSVCVNPSPFFFISRDPTCSCSPWQGLREPILDDSRGEVDAGVRRRGPFPLDTDVEFRS